MTEANKPAFPGLETFEKFDDETARYVEYTLPAGGLTKREYFAALAMQGIMSLNPPDMVQWAGIGKKDVEREMKNVGQWVAFNACAVADALITELSVKETGVKS